MKAYVRSRYAALMIIIVACIVVLYYWYNRDTSVYSAYFTEQAFRKVEIGMDEKLVYRILGPPLTEKTTSSPETWYYGASVVKRSWWIDTTDQTSEFGWIEFDRVGHVIGVSGKRLQELIKVGLPSAEVLAILGKPQKVYPQESKILYYSKPSDYGMYRARIISIDEFGLVSDIVMYDMHD